MEEHKILHLPISIAPNVVRFIGNDLNLNDYIERFVITQAKANLRDETILQELGFKGKPDLSKLKVEYPVSLELQQNGLVESHVVINVPFLDEDSVKPDDKVQLLQEDRGV